MADKFVSEKELEEERELRQAEWEKVRKPEDPKEAPEPENDHRPLYERLKEQREKKQMEYEETHRLKNMVRGLDSEEIGFLDFVDNMKSAEEKKREKEERDLLSEVQKLKERETLERQEIVAGSPSVSSSTKKITCKNSNTQAKLIAGAIKRKSSSGENQVDLPESKKRAISGVGDDDSARINENSAPQEDKPNAVTVECGFRPSVMQCVGMLPGIGIVHKLRHGKVQWTCERPKASNLS